MGCMRQVLSSGALGRPRGIGWRGRRERGSGWGIHVPPWLIHVNVWQNPLKCCEVISRQLIKINEKKMNEVDLIRNKVQAKIHSLRLKIWAKVSVGEGCRHQSWHTCQDRKSPTSNPCDMATGPNGQPMYAPMQFAEKEPTWWLMK